MGSFTSAFLGEVQHPKNVLREYLTAFRNKCQADILSWLDGWTNTKRLQNKSDCWIWLVLKDLASELGYCKDTVFRHLKTLVELGIIERREAKRWCTDKAWEYRIVPEQLVQYVGFNKNLTIDVEKSDYLESENRTSTVQNQDTFLNTYINHSENLPPVVVVADENVCEEEIRQIKTLIANAPFMKDDHSQESSLLSEPTIEERFPAAVARTILERLRDLNIPPTQEVRSLVAQTPEAQLERNVSALEEEAATKGLRSPIGAFKHFIKNNCQPRDERQSWLHRAAVALGKERRDRLIRAVTEYAGAIRVFFTNGRQIALAQAQVMTWEAIAALGDEP